MIRTVQRLAAGAALLALAAAASAKLPPPSPEAKAKAAETAAKAAWTEKVAAFQLCKAQDRAVAHYQGAAKQAGKEVKPTSAAAACTDPGPFAYTPPESKPLEAAGAHSPPATAATPPSSNVPQAQGAAPAKKP